MASIGKMAAVVAHEINNPLSGILTYAKLVRRWLDHDNSDGHQREDLRVSRFDRFGKPAMRRSGEESFDFLAARPQ